MKDACDVVAAGHICLDIIPAFAPGARFRPEDLFAPGRLTQVGAAHLSSGGPVSNTGLALQALGVRARLAAKLGDDLFGRALRELVAERDPDLSAGLVTDKNAATSYTVIISPPGVDRIFFHCPGANDDFDADDVSGGLTAGARLFHFGYPTVMRRMYENGGRGLAEVFRRAKAAGAATSLDLTFPDPASAAGRADWPAILGAALAFVDVFLPSIEEILFLLRRREYEALAKTPGGVTAAVPPELISEVGRQLLEMGAKIVCLKLGDRGFYLRTTGRTGLEAIGRGRPADPAAWADRELWAPCFRVETAGTTGAGDAAIAGFLAALLKGLPPERAAVMAAAVGACCVEAPDALSGLKSWEDTLRRVERGWKRRELKVQAPGWRFDERAGVWMKTSHISEAWNSPD